MDLDNTAKIISGISGPLLILLSVFKDLIPFLKRKKDEFFYKIINSSILTDNCSEEFKKKFIEPEVEDFYFYNVTGINTNTNTKYKYIEFKNKLGGNFTWQKIKEANLYIYSEDNGELTIKINKIENFVYYLTSYVFIPICFFGIVFLYYMLSFYEQQLEITIIYFVGIVSCLLLIVFFLNMINPTRIAKNIKKRIENISEGK